MRLALGSGVPEWSLWEQLNRPVWLPVEGSWDADTQSAKLGLKSREKLCVRSGEGRTDVEVRGDGSSQQEQRRELSSQRKFLASEH